MRHWLFVNKKYNKHIIEIGGGAHSHIEYMDIKNIKTYTIVDSLSFKKKIHQLKEAKIRERLQNAISSGLIYAAAGNANAADLEIKKIDKLAKNKDENNEIIASSNIINIIDQKVLNLKIFL